MYAVYWLENNQPQHQVFDTVQITETLKFTEMLRLRQRNGEAVAFVTFCSENPNSVGLAGVSDKLPEGYDWKKRRI
jgi:hypothetical protein